MAHRSLPRTEAHLERTKLAYVSLPDILEDVKRDRSARITGFVAIDVGELACWIFMEEGSPVTAVRRDPGGRARVTPITDAVRLASEESERGRILYYGAPAGQLTIMFSLTGDPLAGPVAGTRAAGTLEELLENGKPAALEVREPGALHFLRLEDGEVREAYWAPDAPAELRAAGCDGADVREYLRSGGDGAELRAFPPVDELPSQATPALAALYRVLLERTADRVRRDIGEEAAVRALRTGREHARTAYPGIEAFHVVGDRVEGEPVLDDDRLTESVVAWFLRTLEVAESEGVESSAEVAEEVTREWRHALKEAGFLSRLPWPLPT